MTVDRGRLGKCIAMLGSAHEGERSNALAAASAELTEAGMTWLDIACLAERTDVQSPEREHLFDRLVRDRLAEGYAVQHRMTTVERVCMGQVETMLAAGVAVRNVPIEDLASAIEIADVVRRRDPAKGPRRVNWG